MAHAVEGKTGGEGGYGVCGNEHSNSSGSYSEQMEGVGDCADSWGGDGIGGSGALAIGHLLCSLVYPFPLFYQKTFKSYQP